MLLIEMVGGGKFPEVYERVKKLKFTIEKYIFKDDDSVE